MSVFKGFDLLNHIKLIQWHLLGALVLGFTLSSFFSPLILSIAAIPILGWLSYQVIKNKLNQALKLKVGWAKQHFVENEIFLAEPLFDLVSIDNLNINHLDNLQDNATSRIEALNTVLETLSKKSWREHPWIVDAKLHKQKNNYKIKLNTQKLDIQSKLRILADNIAKNIKCKIVHLKPTFTDAGQLTPSLQPLELERLMAFISLHANQDQKESLAKNTEIINIFIQDLSLKNLQCAKFLYKNNEASSSGSIPWGGYTRFSAHFIGWKNLIQGWMLKGEKKQAMLDLLSVLEGTLQLTPIEFKKRIQLLNANEKLKKLIQKHLFLLLDDPAQVLLLSDKDAEKIHAWFEKNEPNIKGAQTFIAAVFESEIVEEDVILENLANHIELLDSAALIFHISKIQPESAFAARAEIYFQHYKGDHSLAHFLLRFLPASAHRAHLLHQICTKRLYWSIEEAQAEALDFESFVDEKNTNLFNALESGWNFDICAEKHSYYSQYTANFDAFLQAAADHGFCKESLVRTYKSKHAKV